MKISLKLKLTISYILLSLLLVGSLLIASNYFLEKRFQSYIIENQEKENKRIVELVADEFGENGTVPSSETLEKIGENALADGIILMVNNLESQELFCMSTLDSQVCDDMIQSMSDHMVSIYPNFNGEYTQKEYEIINNGVKVGTATLGYYGPFFYNDQDVQFLKILNKIFLFVSILSLIVAALLGYFMANRISRPIKKVIDKTKQIEKGNYKDRLEVSSRTKEINQLVNSMNSLAYTLNKQQESKKRMAGDYAHEFRTPLATLQLSLEAMIDGIWEPTTERLENCREEILRLARMISDIDKITEIENDILVLNKTQFDLADTVEKVILNFMPEMQAKNLSLETDLKKSFVYADKDKIIQVIINLLSNAIKYTDKNGKIKLTVKKHNNSSVLIVSDTGIGIAEEDLKNIFEYFYRTDKSRNRKTGGSGIGLAVVKAIVDAHEGTIETKSEPGHGSEFKVYLPK